MSHLQRDWDYAPLRGFVQALARHRRVIRMDAPGNGLSRSRAAPPDSVDPHVDAMRAVLDDAGVERASVFAGSSGCAVAVEFAARYPERVRRLILTGAYLDGSSIAPAADRAALIELVRRSWGVSSRVMSDIFYPDANAEERAAYARHQRSTATAQAAATGLEAVYAYDATRSAAAVTAPTLVIHRRGDRAIPLALGVQTAAAIPGAQLEVVDGVAHHPWHGDVAAVLRPALAFDGVDEETLRRDSFAPHDAAPAGADAPAADVISPREREVLLLVSQGRTDAQIAAELFLSIHTVHRHVANARTKLSVSSRSAAAAWVAAHPE
nr:alpha/beta fold hydrolase [Microbacterium sp. CFH 90308]